MKSKVINAELDDHDPFHKQPADSSSRAPISLPIHQYKAQIVDLITSNNVLVLVGETGCGKSTQVPQILVDYSNAHRLKTAKIVVTQPRRLAAISVAERVAYERKVQVGGNEVGYAVRFDDKSLPNTRIRFVTHGVLLREACGSSSSSSSSNPKESQHLTSKFLSSYDVVVLDEVHERCINTDMLLGMTKAALLSGSATFKLVLMSATVNVKALTDFFARDPKSLLHSSDLNDKSSLANVCKLRVAELVIPGRSFPVERMFTTQAVAEYVHAAVITCAQIHVDEKLPGDILCFLAGQEEIDAACILLKEHLERHLGSKCAKAEVIIYPLYATLSADEQRKAIEPWPLEVRSTRRKVIFATNVAETSITIPGVCFVVDSGMCKMRISTSASMHSLQTVPVSQAQAAQRAGRAGRECPGKAFSLFTEDALLNVMSMHEPPEILRCDVADAILALLALKIDIRTFDFIDAPPIRAVGDALELLVDLGALTKKMQVTPLGLAMAALPLVPMLARCFLESLVYKCEKTVSHLCALLSLEGGVFINVRMDQRSAADAARKRVASPFGDHITLLNIFETYLKTPPKDRSAYCRDLFLSSRAMRTAASIHEQLLDLASKKRVVHCAKTYLESMKKAKNKGAPEVLTRDGVVLDSSPAADSSRTLVRKCMMAGFFRHAARLSEASANLSTQAKLNPNSIASIKYVSLKGREEAFLHPSSVLRWRRSKPQYVLYHELVLTGKKYIRNVMEIDQEFVHEYFRI